MTLRSIGTRTVMVAASFFCLPALALTDNAAFVTTTDKLWTLNLVTGAQSLLGTAGSSQFLNGLSFRPSTGQLYALDQNNIRILSTVNGSVLSNLGNHGVPVGDTHADIAFSPQGTLLLIHDETLYSVNLAFGQATVIGATGLDKAGGLAFSPDGRLFAIGEVASLNGVAGLVRLNPATGATIQVVGALNDPANPGPFNQGSIGIRFDSKGRLFLIYTGPDRLYRVSLEDATATQVAGIAVSNGSLAIFHDCNGNGVFDSQDIIAGTSLDLDSNGIPDECTFCNDAECDLTEDSCDCPEDCGSPPASELTGATCQDNVDNDCDLAVDCDDSDCAFEPTCVVPIPGGPGDLLWANLRVDGITGQLLYTFPLGPTIIGPRGIAIGPDGRFYVAGIQSRNVAKYDMLSGLLIGTFVQSESGGLFAPTGITFGPDGNLYVSDFSRDRVLRFSGQDGAYIDDFVTQNSGGLDEPWDLAFGPDGQLYVTSDATNSVLRYNGSSGTFIGEFVTPSSGGLLRPRGLRFWLGSLFVSSSVSQGAVYRYDAGDGSFQSVFVQPGTGGLRDPYGIDFGPDGDLYVTSSTSNAVMRFDGQTGALKTGFYYGPELESSSYIHFLPAQCATAVECDDSNPLTVDRCVGYACVFQTRPILFVNANAGAVARGDPGSSWDSAFIDLQDALDLAASLPRPVEIWVAEGMYTPDRGTGDRNAAFRMSDGVSMYGGFSGTESLRDERNPDAHLTILSGDLAGNDSPGFQNNSDNSYHVVIANGTGKDYVTIIDGFVITSGNATGPSFEEGLIDRGGGMLIFRGSPTVSRCVFEANQGTLAGGLHVESLSRPTLNGCRFVGNRASSGGGMVCHSNGDAIIVNSAFSGNAATDGAAMYIFASTPTLTNCTISFNIATSGTGGVFNIGKVTTITNSILWGNSDAGGTDESAQLGGANWSINHTCVQGWTGSLGGLGNTGDCAPDFLNARGNDNKFGTADDDLRLSFDSPNLDAANADADTDNPLVGLQPLPGTDANGGPRVLGPAVDRGAYEFNLSSIPAVSTWGVVILALVVLAAGCARLRYGRRGMNDLCR